MKGIGAIRIDRLWCAICGCPHGAPKLRQGWVAFGITYGIGDSKADIARRLLCPSCRGSNQIAEQPGLVLEYGG